MNLFRKSGTAPYAHVFGCSHSIYFRSSTTERLRFNPSENWPIIAGKTIGGASVAGVRPHASTLSTKEIIAKGCIDAKRLVLAFGQVDLELGYYFRIAVKGDDIEATDYVNWLVDIYAAFIEKIDFPKSEIAIKGVNITVLTDPDFTLSYVKRIVLKDNPKGNRLKYKRRLKRCILSEAEQNEMSLSFNKKIMEYCDSRGSRYFDINDFLSKKDENGVPRPNLGVDRAFVPAKFDHHVVDSVHVRETHLSALLKVFDD